MHPYKKRNREAYANFLRAKYEAYTHASTVHAFPFYLVIDPSDACQLRCPTCPTGRENEDRRVGGSNISYRSHRAAMKPELFDALLDELGPYLFSVMFYNWGEPLLNKSLPEFIRKAHAYDIETEVHSNLSLPLSPRRIEDLLTSGLDILKGSIDGFTQEAYQLHRVGGDIKLVKKNLETLAATRDRLGLSTRIVYKMLMFRHNEHEVKAVKRYCSDIGIEFSKEEAVIHNEDWLPSYRQGEPSSGGENIRGISDLNGLLAFANWARDYFAEHERKAIWLPGSLKGEDTYPQFCSWHYGVSVVTGGGPVSPCCATAKERDDFGRVVPGQARFADVWNNDSYRHARAVLAEGDLSATEGVDTLCDHCIFPKAVQHLYSIHDLRIVAAFHREFGRTEPALEAGFRIMSSIRYGRLSQALLRRGILNPLVLLLSGKGDERDMAPFVRVYEEHLLDEPDSLDHTKMANAAIPDGSSG